MDLRVECEEGASGTVEPAVIWFGSRRVPVRAVVDRWYGSHHRWWKVETDEGAYVLRSNVTDWSDEDLWRAYAQLSDAEAAFRIHKSDLKIRPIWHHGDERVKAHILVCFLGYVMWKTLEGWQSRAGLGNSPRTILEELRRIESVDVYLPVVDGPELVLRCVVQPDKDQAALLDRLGLRLPQRLRMPRSLRWHFLRLEALQHLAPTSAIVH